LGLLIIDEEQKFGVAQKEKLKRKRVDTHVLSMSATPIPRTLNMALSGVKDISVITTAPVGRKPVKNKVEKFSWEKAAQAIKKEVSRGGQVYFVHNRVDSLGHIKKRLEQRLGGISIAIGHGQMPGAQLAKVMRDFNNGVWDVLLCTTIIENGLDLPNVNTLIIDRSEMYGLSQLYQLRGRIGRGHRQAYAYFFYHGVGGGMGGIKKGIRERVRTKENGGEAGAKIENSDDKNQPLWLAARKRLEAIRDLEDLGSGFGVAQRDLEIRGAGNFLGRKQHGNVSSVGFSLYCALLAEMVDKLKKES
jgi:transcription-repair coupling factor (superfamily II helicase)